MEEESVDEIEFEPASLIVSNKERTAISPIIISKIKNVELHFIDEEVTKNVIVQASEVTEIMYTFIPYRHFWCAIKQSDKAEEVPEIMYQIYFSVRREKNKSDSGKKILKLLKALCTNAVFTSVCPPVFCKHHPNIEDFLFYDMYFYKFNLPNTIENGNKPSSQINTEKNSETAIFSPPKPGNDDIVVKFSDGSTEVIPHSLLVTSLEPTGWLCNSVVDIMVNYFKFNRLSEGAYSNWKDSVQFYDSFFVQKILRADAALQSVSFDNYKQVMQEVYPLKNGVHRNVPIFQKELIVVPVICRRHWFLIFVHRPMDAAIDSITEYTCDNEDQKKRCRIIILDSKTGHEHVRDKLLRIHEIIYNCLKNWISLMIYHHGEFANLKRGCLKIECERIPMQPNDDDCGVFLLMFIEEFILNDWSWTDWSHSALKELTVKDMKSFQERILEYRDFISKIVKQLAINIPQIE